jgi:acyl phosphate:glycerol-3-phosphate acyltransferase
MWLLYPILAGASYLLGSTPVGLLVGRRVRGVDIRDFGSGKTGFTNSLRTLGLVPSIFVIVGDIAKGAVPVLVAGAVSGSPSLKVVTATAAVVGHVWPLFAGFKGGRGVATSWGATFAMMPALGVGLLVIAAVLAYAYRYMSLVSVVGTCAGAAIVWFLIFAGRLPAAYGVWGLLASAIIVAGHRDNLQRLRNGTEPKIGQGGQRRSSPGNANV